MTSFRATPRALDATISVGDVEPTPGEPGHYRLELDASDPALLEAVRRVAELLPADFVRLAERKRDALIEDFVAVFARQTPTSAVEQDLAAENARLRAAYVAEVPTSTSAEVHALAGMAGRNASQTANRWKKQRSVFSVPFQGRDRFPAFQFAEGRPKPQLRAVLTTLDGLTPWQIAFWFETANGWLGSATPRHAIDSRPDAVVEAARRAVGEAVG